MDCNANKKIFELRDQGIPSESLLLNKKFCFMSADTKLDQYVL